VSQIQNSIFKVQSSRFKVQGSKFKVQSSRFKVQGHVANNRFFDVSSGFDYVWGFMGVPDHPIRGVTIGANHAL
jgi:hypothetical protein